MKISNYIEKKLIFAVILIITTNLNAQSFKTVLDLKFSVADFPFNSEAAYHYPSIKQSIELSNDMYDLTFWGINSLGNVIVKNNKNTKAGKFLNFGLKYALDLAFVKFGSELPLPFGIWAHEEFHRSVFVVNNINAKNGNWIFERWDGTVFGVSDEQLTDLKQNNISNLLYSYVAGVQSENLSTISNFINDFYNERTFYKNALYLYNAYYVWNYFSFSTSSFTDSVKIIAPKFESKNPEERDFAGADLTAWVYDMFGQNEIYTNRDLFPDGDGVNRRIAFSELTIEGQNFLQKQKKLSLINFINPAIFFINCIKPKYSYSVNFFAQYNPTNFGNAISSYLLFKYNKTNVLNLYLGIHNYNNFSKHFYGAEIGIMNIEFEKISKLETSMNLNIWSQPENQNFFDTKGKIGGSTNIEINYKLSRNFKIFADFSYKTKGWEIGNQYLDEKFQISIGLKYKLFDRSSIK